MKTRIINSHDLRRERRANLRTPEAFLNTVDHHTSRLGSRSTSPPSHPEHGMMTWLTVTVRASSRILCFRSCVREGDCIKRRGIQLTPSTLSLVMVVNVTANTSLC